MAVIDDVARLAGVSKATASRALSGRGSVADATRQRVMQAAAALDFRASPAAVSLATGRSGALGVLAPAIDTWYVSTLLRGIAEAALAHDLDVVLYDLGRGAEMRGRVFERFLQRHHIDALISTTFALTHREVSRLASIGIPAVALGDGAAGVRSWCLDDERVGTLATEHLLSLGHRRIVHVGGSTVLDESLFAAERLRERGYQRAMRAAGLEPEPTRLHDPTVAAAHEHAVELLRSPTRPTAIFAATDEIAMGILLAARTLGMRVPDELSVVGVDDHSYAAAFDLTTVHQDPREHGERIVDWVVADLASPSGDTTHTLIEPRLVVRGSTSAA